jgi:tripartite-type tricarboxylate transporter receptor subunit TctC
MLRHRRIVRSVIVIGLGLIASAPIIASAQVIAKPARLVIGFPPGGVSDVVARQLAERLRGTYAPTVIVDNRPGAGGRIGTEAVKNAEADGSVILVSPSPMITIYPHIYRRLAYDPLRDLAAVMILGSFPIVMVAGPALPAEINRSCRASRSPSSWHPPRAVGWPTIPPRIAEKPP